MADQSGRIDLTNLIAALQAMTEVINQNSSALAMGLVNTLTETNTTLTGILTAGKLAAKWLHITGAGTFQAPGTVSALLVVNINMPDAAASAEIYDASSPALPIGSVMIADLDLGPIDPITIQMGPNNRGLALNNGLVVITTGTADITVSYV